MMVISTPRVITSDFNAGGDINAWIFKERNDVHLRFSNFIFYTLIFHFGIEYRVSHRLKRRYTIITRNSRSCIYVLFLFLSRLSSKKIKVVLHHTYTHIHTHTMTSPSIETANREDVEVATHPTASSRPRVP